MDLWGQVPEIEQETSSEFGFLRVHALCFVRFIPQICFTGSVAQLHPPQVQYYMQRIRLSISFLLLFFPALLLTAQIKLVGTHAGSGGVHVLRWNANTGALLNDVPTTAQGYVMGASVFDAYAGQYYFRDPVGLQRLSFSPDAADLIPVQYDLSNAEIDMQDGKIYALHYEPIFDTSGTLIGSSLDFMQYHLSDSTETLLLAIGDCSGYVSDASAYDSNHGIFYFLGVDSTQQTCLYSVTTSNGNYAYTKTPLSSPGFFLATLDYDNDHDILYGLGHLASPANNLQIHMIDVGTAALTLEADLPQFIGLQIGSNTYDQSSHTMVFRALDSILSTWGYDTQAHLLTSLQEPMANISEYEADNSDYASVKYGAVGSLDAQPTAASLTAFPNPAQDRLTLRLPQARTDATLTVYDVRGMQVARLQVPAGEAIVLDVQAFRPGAYFVQALVDGQLKSTQFVVSR